MTTTTTGEATTVDAGTWLIRLRTAFPYLGILHTALPGMPWIAVHGRHWTQTADNPIDLYAQLHAARPRERNTT